MRILIAIGVPRQQEAGAAGVVFNHARELSEQGHAVECWFLDDLIKQQEVPKRFEAIIFSLRVMQRIRAERINFDVVNLHAPWGCAYGVWKKVFRPRGAPPYVMTMHGSEERYSLMMRREHAKGRAWHFGWRNRLWHQFYHQLMYRYSVRTADYGAIANREGAICAQLCGNGDPCRFWYVPNGVGKSFFTPREYPEKPSLALLFVGTWLDRKGIYYLAEAFEHLAKKNPELHLTIAGCLCSESSVKKFFAVQVRERVRVIPFVERQRMPELYAEHDIFVFPSLVEGMPLTLLEAMASGMPVVTTNICGMADVVEDGRNGLLVPPADAAALAAATERLFRSCALRHQLGEEAQQSMSGYRWNIVAGRLESVFTLAVQNRAKN